MGNLKHFCQLNEIENVDDFIINTLTIGFNVEKYGNAPWTKEVEKIFSRLLYEGTGSKWKNIQILS